MSSEANKSTTTTQPEEPEIRVVPSNVAPSTTTELSHYQDTTSRFEDLESQNNSQSQSQSQTTITDKPITKQPSNTEILDYRKLQSQKPQETEEKHYRQKYVREESECSEFCREYATCYGTCTICDDWCVHDSYFQNYISCVCMCCNRSNATTCLQAL